MDVGITGTRNGLSLEQARYALREIPWDSLDALHSGDCIGVDEQLHDLAISKNVTSIGHPPIKNDVRAFCEFDLEHEPRGYFPRNRDIVNSSNILYGFPPTEDDPGNGGTWYTINYSMKKGKKTIIVRPSGKVTIHN